MFRVYANHLRLNDKQLTPKETVELLTISTIIKPDKFKFMDKHCSVICADGFIYVRNQETYDKCIEDYKREYGVKESEVKEIDSMLSPIIEKLRENKLRLVITPDTRNGHTLITFERLNDGYGISELPVNITNPDEYNLLTDMNLLNDQKTVSIEGLIKWHMDDYVKHLERYDRYGWPPSGDRESSQD